MIFVVLGLGAVMLLFHLYETRWCSHCKKLSARTDWAVTHLAPVPETAQIGKDYSVVVRARSKVCDRCGTHAVIGASASVCNKEDADIHRTDLQLRAMPVTETVSN